MTVPGYYTALRAAWNAPITPPPPVQGPAFTLQMTTAQKIVAINQWTVQTGQFSSRITVPAWQLYSAIVPAEFQKLNSQQQQYIRDILLLGTIELTNGSSARNVLAQFMPPPSITSYNIALLCKAADIPTMPWWIAPVQIGGGGLTAPVAQSDLDAAGNLF